MKKLKNLSNFQKKNLIIGGLLAVVVIMAVGYAAFASSLKISGTSNISTSWNISITDITTSNKVGSASVSGTPEYSGLKATFNTNLVLPGDSITYNIKVENKGNLNAKLNKITLKKDNNPAILFETTGIKEGNVLKQGVYTTLSVKVTYSNSVTSQPTNLDASLTVTLDFVQSDGSSGSTGGDTSNTAAEMLKAKVVTRGDGLYEDAYETGRYIYRGASPDNYIKLGDDMYRIIAVESDNTLRVIKKDDIGDMIFDEGGTRGGDYDVDYCETGNGCNVWGSKTTTLNRNGRNVTRMKREIGGELYNLNLPDAEATLNTYLNNEWYNGLNNSVQSLIVPHMFNVGLVTENETDLSNTIEQEQEYKWNGKIGLMNVSDYVKASTNSVCTSVNEYYNTSSCYNNSDIHNWIYAGPVAKSDSWTIAPWSGDDTLCFFVTEDGKLDDEGIVDSNKIVAPVFFLNSNITLSGTGTSSDPYIPTLSQ